MVHQGLHVLDLGSGSGRDCYVCSALVGEEGSVTGIDMTDSQNEVNSRGCTLNHGNVKSNPRAVTWLSATQHAQRMSIASSHTERRPTVS